MKKPLSLAYRQRLTNCKDATLQLATDMSPRFRGLGVAATKRQQVTLTTSVDSSYQRNKSILDGSILRLFHRDGVAGISYQKVADYNNHKSTALLRGYYQSLDDMYAVLCEHAFEYLCAMLMNDIFNPVYAELLVIRTAASRRLIKRLVKLYGDDKVYSLMGMYLETE